MASTKAKESTLAREKRGTSTSNAQATQSKRNVTKQSKLSLSSSSSPSTSSSAKVTPKRSVPSYLKPTLSSISEPQKQGKKTAPEGSNNQRASVRAKSFGKSSSLCSPVPQQKTTTRSNSFASRPKPALGSGPGAPTGSSAKSQLAQPTKYVQKGSNASVASNVNPQPVKETKKEEVEPVVEKKEIPPQELKFDNVAGIDPSIEEHENIQTFEIETIPENHSQQDFALQEAAEIEAIKEQIQCVQIEAEEDGIFDEKKSIHLDKDYSNENDVEAEQEKEIEEEKEVDTESKIEEKEAEVVDIPENVEEKEDSIIEIEDEKEPEGDAAGEKDKAVVQESKAQPMFATFKPVEPKKVPVEESKPRPMLATFKKIEPKVVAAQESKPEPLFTAFKRQGVRTKRDTVALQYNSVIEETAGKLLEQKKNKVSALVGAFQTVIEYESK